MKLEEQKIQLINLLYQACLSDISYIKKEYIDNHFFAYAVYCDSGFTSFGGAACSREGIENHIDKEGDDAYLYAETFAAEWNYVNNYWQAFEELNTLIEEIFNAFYDNEIQDLISTAESLDFKGLHDFFIEVIIATMKKLKESLCFNSLLFEQDILLGLQFGDPSIEERKLIIKVSENVNSPEWHSKMLKAYKDWL